MIERIYVKNFRRIGECDINLRDGLTVLIGKNGTGKSSIIEAITFNLYGKVKDGTTIKTVRRKNAADDDPTIAIVDFSLNNTHYRCRRWFTPKGSTMASLHSFTQEQYEELLEKPILDFDKTFGTEIANSTSGVTTAIVNLLGITHDGFKASFVAQQKELDSFASFAPEARKKFFLDLLGYSALDKVKPDLSGKVNALQKTIESLENQNLNVNEIQKRILSNEKQIADLVEKARKGQEMLADVESKHVEASKEYEEARIVREKVTTYQEDIEKLSQEKATLVQQCSELTQRITTNKEATKDFDASSSIAEQLHNAEEKARKNKELLKIKSDKEQIETIVGDTLAEIDKKNKEIAQLQEQTKVKPDLDTPSQKVQDLITQYGILDAEKKNLNASATRLTELIASVEAGRVAKCPTCGNSIGNAEGKEHLSKELAELQSAQAENEKALAQCTADGKVAREEKERVQRALETFELDQKKLDRLQQQVKTDSSAIEERKKRLEELISQENAIGTPLTQKEEFLLNEEIIKLTSQKENEDKMRELVTQLSSDTQALTFKQERIQAIDTELETRNEYVKNNKKQANSTDKKLETKTSLEDKITKYRARLNEINENRASYQGALDADNGNLTKAMQQSEQLAELKVEVEDAICAQQVVEILRKELPARVAPRLSDVAGHILDIATNGRYSMIELDEKYNVRVYTDDDIRNIAQMSGGEADVIALALRIAIAKILLEASGMPTQTFILDEIFGALDDERRESTCSALMNIQNELSKILCITHIDEIKDMADYTYVVEMDENGISWVREQINTPAMLMKEAQQPNIAEMSEITESKE